MENKIVNGLYGSTFDKSKSCAYCSHHHCYLTVKQLKQHECLKKQCFYLHKIEEHDWWRYRNSIKEKKKLKG